MFSYYQLILPVVILIGCMNSNAIPFCILDSPD